MRGWRRQRISIGAIAAIAAGVVIILCLILPLGFWWLFAAGLIAAGILLLRQC